LKEWLGHHSELRLLLDWAIYTDAFRLGSALMYVIFAVGLWSLGARYQAAVVRGEPPPGQFPEGYFTMLAVQLIPLTITGFVLKDVYIIATRTGTLGIVLTVYGMVASKDGTYDTWWYRLRMTFWLSVAIMGPMVWISSVHLQVFVHDWEQLIAYASVAVMIAFVIWGQGVAAKELFRHYVQGHYTVKRFRLQVVRFFGFALQAAHYGLAPLIEDEPFAWRDPIFLQGTIGAIGAFSVLAWSILGMIKGTGARREKRRGISAAANTTVAALPATSP
jgi:hypothetical protein